MIGHWKAQRERAGSFWISILVWVALNIGRSAVLVLLFPISFFYLIFARDAVRSSKRYLCRVLKKKVIWLDVWRHFYYFSVVSVDRLYFVTGKIDCLSIRFQGEELLKQASNLDKGCILLVSHLGSFDALRVSALVKHNMPLKILMDYHHNPATMKIIDRLNPGFARCIIDSNQSTPALALTLSELLKNKHMIGIMADRTISSEKQVPCKLLTGEVSLPAGPWLLAGALRVPVLLCFGLYEGSNRYTIYVELVDNIVSIDRKNREQKLAQYVQNYANRIEYYANQEPYNWFNFYEFWNDEPQIPSVDGTVND